MISLFLRLINADKSFVFVTYQTKTASKLLIINDLCLDSLPIYSDIDSKYGCSTPY